MASNSIIRRLRHLSHFSPAMPCSSFCSFGHETFGSDVNRSNNQQPLHQKKSRTVRQMSQAENEPRFEKELQQACHERAHLDMLVKQDMKDKVMIQDSNDTYISHFPRILRNPTGHFTNSKMGRARYVCWDCPKLKLQFSKISSSEEVEHHDIQFMYEDFVAPPSVDWRKLGVVTPVQQQIIDGSCWSFSSIASVESINAIMTGQLIKLSEQQLIDCISITHGAFEEGGLPANAFWYIKQNRGVVPAESYPYVARKSACKIFEDYMVTIDGYQFVPQDENSLEKAVANQPVVVDVASGGVHGWMRNYSGGIADCHHETPYSELDHSMLAVAYGTEKSGRKYWVCKNSLGPTWGKKGYCHIARGVGYKGGAFGIAKAACFPVKTSPNRRGSIKDEAMLIDQDFDK